MATSKKPVATKIPTKAALPKRIKTLKKEVEKLEQLKKAAKKPTAKVTKKTTAVKAKATKPAAKAKVTKPRVAKVKDAIIHLVLDRSGSMSSIWNEAIGAINTFIDDQKKQPGKATFSLSIFDDHYNTVHDNIDITNVKSLDANDSNIGPRGMTALYDAVGRSVRAELERKAPKSALRIIAIQTDGGENSSKEFRSMDDVQKVIKSATDKGWQVLFLGANLDVNAFSKGTGMAFGAAAAYNTNDPQSVARTISTLSASTTSYRASGGVQSINLAQAVEDAEKKLKSKV